jgi:hypothetical protein
MGIFKLLVDTDFYRNSLTVIPIVILKLLIDTDFYLLYALVVIPMGILSS